MKRSSCIFGLIMMTIALVFNQTAKSQTYNYITTTGTSAPYEERGYQNTILDLPANDVLTPWQTLPFYWEFYGQPVTGYFASDNGYITFDPAATISYAVNDTLPNSSNPNNAIYAFWDNFQLTTVGLADKIVTSTYGQAPARVHVIQWYSVTPYGTGSTVFFAIRIYENGGFDIIHSFNNGSSYNGTVGCENADGTIATFLPDAPNTVFPALAASNVPSDDVVHRFHYGTYPVQDIRMMTTAVEPSVSVGGNITISGTLENNGTSVLNSFDLYYTVNYGEPHHQHINGLSVQPGTVYTFTHSELYPVSTAGLYHIRVWAKNPNLITDSLAYNDSISVSTAAILGDTSSTKRVLIEQFTGTWCGYCPDGAWVLDTLDDKYPDVIITAIHAGGGAAYALENNDGIQIASAFTNSYPSAAIDRKYYSGTYVGISRSLWYQKTTEQHSLHTPMDIDINSVYNAIDRKLNLTIHSYFKDYAAGDIRLTVYLVEDSVTGSGTGYNQANYYNAGPTGYPGHPYYGAGNPIIGYNHRHVLRKVITPTWGDATFFHLSAEPNDTLTAGYSDISVDPNYNINRLSAVAFLSYYNSDSKKRTVINAQKIKISEGSVISINDDKNFLSDDFYLYSNYPNPFNPTTSIRYDLKEKAKVTLKIFNTLGQEVRTLVNNEQNAGQYTLQWDGKNNAGLYVSSGVYIYRIQAGDFVKAKKMMFIK